MVTVELISPEREPFTVSYVVIAARHKGGWLFVRHRRRGGYELPAGHPDAAEDTVEAAVRELTEETGAMGFVNGAGNVLFSRQRHGKTVWQALLCRG